MSAMRCKCCRTLAPSGSYTYAEASSGVCAWCAGDHDRSHPEGWRDSAG